MISKNKEEEFISPSELDDRLRADKDGSLKKNIIQKLQSYETKVKGAMNKGDLAPNQFEAAEQMMKAIAHAEAIIQDRVKKDAK